MLICVLRSFLVSRPGNIEEAIDARLHSIGALVSQLKRLLCIVCVFIDDAINELLNRCHVLRSAKLQGRVRLGNKES